MLSVLRKITQEVSQARDLNHALSIIVNRIQDAMGTDVCSVYLADEKTQHYSLMATVGLNPKAVGQVALKFGEGLVSLVVERGEPVNIDNAPEHPRFCFIQETHEAPYHGFLGVPIIHHRNVLGVLVVQQKAQRLFEEDETALLLTIAAQLSGAIAHAEISGGIGSMAGNNVNGLSLKGVGGAPGVVVGKAMVMYPPADLTAIPDRQVEDVAAEIEAFMAALSLAKADIKGMHARLSSILSNEDQALFDAYLQMLGSASIVDQVIEKIRAGSWASGALRDTVNAHALMFEGMDDPYMQERADDIRDLGRRLLRCLQKGRGKPPPFPQNVILVGEEITATMLAEVPVEKLAGVVSARGSSTSHVAILARALGVPAVVGVTDLPVARLDDRALVVDGYSGRIYIDPPEAIRSEYLRLGKEEDELTAGLAELRTLPAETTDGFRVPLYANSGLLSDITPSLRCGAEGIGLYRTEFPFMIRDRFPSEDEQCRIYQQIAEAFAPQPVVLRTLDVGGDKSLPYFPIQEENPFLGWRGVRITLDHPELFLVQTRAMLKAQARLGNIRILLPMVSSLAELDEACGLIDKAYRELVQGGLVINKPRIGVMIEVPSLVYQIDAVVQRVDFVSVGSNDLTQYLLAVDRNNASVAQLYDSLSPAVVMAIKQVVDGAHRHQCPVSVCGEMAGNPAAAILLVGMGVDYLSMSASSLGRVKCVIREISQVQAQSALAHVLNLDGAAQIREYLSDMLIGMDLGGLVRAGSK